MSWFARTWSTGKQLDYSLCSSDNALNLGYSTILHGNRAIVVIGFATGIIIPVIGARSTHQPIAHVCYSCPFARHSYRSQKISVRNCSCGARIALNEKSAWCIYIVSFLKHESYALQNTMEQRGMITFHSDSCRCCCWASNGICSSSSKVSSSCPLGGPLLFTLIVWLLLLDCDCIKKKKKRKRRKKALPCEKGKKRK